MEQNKDKKHPTSKIGPAWIGAFWIAVFWVAVIYIFSGIYSGHQRTKLAYSDFKDQVEQGNVERIKVEGNQITGKLKKPVGTGGGKEKKTSAYFTTTLPSFGDRELMGLLEAHKVTIEAESSTNSWLWVIAINLLPWLVLLGIFLLISRKMQSRMGGGGIFGIGRSKAKLYQKTESDVTFKDVAGLENAKKDLREVIDFLKDPARFHTLGAKLPKGVLLAGPPGTGKTLLARACAGEADVPFFSTSASEFVEMFVGVGASRVRDMFQNAKQKAPCIIFIDEIDSIGRARGIGVGGGHEEREQTLNQILAEMDGFSPYESVAVMAATNRPDILDPALVRPGRFDRQITLELPHKKAREEILRIHARSIPVSSDVDLERMAGMTAGFSGADLKNLVNEAALLAGREKKQQVDAEAWERARDKILLGGEQESVMSDEEKRVTAYHEAGHALLASLLPGTDPLKKVTIIPHGRSLGATEQIPEERHHFSRSYLSSRIAIMLGGRAAEQLVFDDVTSGAANDLKQATELARRMVCEWGMSERIGPISLPSGDHHPFLGDGAREERDVSEQTAEMIDEEIQNIIRENEQTVEKILQQQRDKLDRLAGALLEHEVLDEHQVERLLQGRDGRKRPAPH